MNAENFDPKESLLLIESMINRAKDKFAEAMLIAWIIPGYLLRAKYKSQ